MKLVLHPTTQLHLAQLQAQPTHATLLVGPVGIGKRSLAIILAETILKIDDVGGYPYALQIAPVDGKAIGIEAVRQLEQFLSLKVPSQSQPNRIIIIEDAHLLTQEAQNALLKTLEEPPAGTLLLLTASHQQALLPTIRSRVQTLTVSRPERRLVERHFASLDYEKAQIDKAYAISGGLPGLMSTLLSESDHPLVEATQRARQILSQTSYQRLLLVDDLAKQRDQARDVVYILQQMAHVSLGSSQGAAAKKWQSVLTASYEASEALATNAQPKLVLTKLMLNL